MAEELITRVGKYYHSYFRIRTATVEVKPPIYNAVKATLLCSMCCCVLFNSISYNINFAILLRDM